MILKRAGKVYLGSKEVNKIYLGTSLVYSRITPSPPVVSESDMIGSASAETYEEGSTSWGNLTLSSGCTTSKDGIEFQSEETYISTQISNLSYPMSFEFKGRVDSTSYKAQAEHPGMLFGIGPTRDSWGDGITCYSSTDYGIIVDTTGAMSISTYKTPTYVHIVFTLDRSGNMTFYLNGIDNSWTLSKNTATKSTKTYVYNGEGTGRFVGAVNTMRWWDTQLSTTEITELFSADSSDYTL